MGDNTPNTNPAQETPEETTTSNPAPVALDPSDPREMLKSVNGAIYAITVGGQSYKIGSRSLTRADLKQLYAMKNDLMGQIAAENNNTGLFDDCHVAVFDGR